MTENSTNNSHVLALRNLSGDKYTGIESVHYKQLQKDVHVDRMAKTLLSPVCKVDEANQKYTNFSSIKKDKKKQGLDEAIEKLKELNFYRNVDFSQIPAP